MNGRKRSWYMDPGAAPDEDGGGGPDPEETGDVDSSQQEDGTDTEGGDSPGSSAFDPEFESRVSQVERDRVAAENERLRQELAEARAASTANNTTEDDTFDENQQFIPGTANEDIDPVQLAMLREQKRTQWRLDRVERQNKLAESRQKLRENQDNAGKYVTSAKNTVKAAVSAIKELKDKGNADVAGYVEKAIGDFLEQQAAAGKTFTGDQIARMVQQQTEYYRPTLNTRRAAKKPPETKAEEALERQTSRPKIKPGPSDEAGAPKDLPPLTMRPKLASDPGARQRKLMEQGEIKNVITRVREATTPKRTKT